MQPKETRINDYMVHTDNSPHFPRISREEQLLTSMQKTLLAMNQRMEHMEEKMLRILSMLDTFQEVSGQFSERLIHLTAVVNSLAADRVLDDTTDI